jgi:hypothetical protein
VKEETGGNNFIRAALAALLALDKQVRDILAGLKPAKRN